VQIIEIYRSIQGESSFAGRPCTFVRLAACNLRCTWCDSEYTFSGGRKMSVEEVAEEVARLQPTQAKTGLECGTQLKPTSAKDGQMWGTLESTLRSLVEITGGEPMLQEREVVALMERLLASGYEVLVETSGERPLARVPRQVHKIVDVKCPGSGEAGSFRMENLKALTPRDEVKFVIASRQDYEFARAFLAEHELARRAGEVIFSPAFRQDSRERRDVSHCLVDPRELAEWIVADGLEVRLGLQIHKFIWAPETKGV
jgi:7-carboxy-7-deazaguanine synthase